MAESLRVLIVDDSRVALKQLELIVCDIEGVELVGSAFDGAGAVRSAAHFKPDLVLMDVVMPGMDGLAALRIIGATQPATRVVMVSSVAGSPKVAEEAFRLGAVQVMAKPVDRDHLEALFESERNRRAELASR